MRKLKKGIVSFLMTALLFAAAGQVFAEEPDSAEAAAAVAASEEDVSEETDFDETVALQEEVTAKPAAPALLSYETEAGGIRLSWEEVSGAERYAVYLLDETDGSAALLGETEETAFFFDAVVSGERYTFSIAAKSADAESDLEESVLSVYYLAPVMADAARKGDSAVIRWTASEGADRYVILKQTGDQTDWQELGNVTGLRFTDTQVAEGVAYRYLVRAQKDEGGETFCSFTAPSDAAAFRILAAPVLKKAKDEPNGIRVRWKKSSGAASYEVFRRTSGGKWSAIGTAEETEYLDITAKKGVVYYYLVKPYTVNQIRGNFDKKGTAGIHFGTAKAPKVKNRKDGVKITWKKDPKADGFRIYRRQSSKEDWRKLKDVTGKNSYVDITVKSGKAYQYRVSPYKKIRNTNYFSDYNNSSKSAICYLAMPQLKSISSLQKGVKLTWKAVKGAKKYQVFRKTGVKGAWKKLSTTKKKFYVDKTAAQNTLYYYSITAVSGKSVSVLGKPSFAGMHLLKPVMNKPVSVKKGIKISWRPVKGATGYYVYRVAASGKRKLLKKTTKTSFVDRKVQDGQTCTYTVRAYNQNCPACLSDCNAKGKSATYIDPVRAAIRKELDACGWTLEAAFNRARQIPFIDKQPTQTSAKAYAQWTLANRKGDCYGKAAVFCLMARELGYECYLMQGWVPFANGGGSEHGWVEINVSGTWYVCDLSFNNGGVNSAYLIQYGQHGTLRYSNYHRMP